MHRKLIKIIFTTRVQKQHRKKQRSQHRIEFTTCSLYFAWVCIIEILSWKKRDIVASLAFGRTVKLHCFFRSTILWILWKIIAVGFYAKLSTKKRTRVPYVCGCVCSESQAFTRRQFAPGHFPKDNKHQILVLSSKGKYLPDTFNLRQTSSQNS